MKIGRFQPRWTLGGLMLVIALLAVPMALYIHQAREIARLRALAEAQRDEAALRLKYAQDAVKAFNASVQAQPK